MVVLVLLLPGFVLCLRRAAANRLFAGDDNAVELEPASSPQLAASQQADAMSELNPAAQQALNRAQHEAEAKAEDAEAKMRAAEERLREAQALAAESRLMDMAD